MNESVFLLHLLYDEHVYNSVNLSESLKELADVVRATNTYNTMSVGDNVVYRYVAEEMAEVCENFTEDDALKLTTEYGIRQQALYLLNYKN